MGLMNCMAGITVTEKLLLCTCPAVDAEESSSTNSSSPHHPIILHDHNFVFCSHSFLLLPFCNKFKSWIFFFFPEACSQCFTLITSITIIKELKRPSLKRKLRSAILFQVHLKSISLPSEVSKSLPGHVFRIHEVTLHYECLQYNLHIGLSLSITLM